MTGDGEAAGLVQQRQRHQQAGDVLGGHIPRQGKGAGTELAAAEKQGPFLTHGHAVGSEYLIQRIKGPLGQAALHVEHGLRP